MSKWRRPTMAEVLGSVFFPKRQKVCSLCKNPDSKFADQRSPFCIACTRKEVKDLAAGRQEEQNKSDDGKF